MKIWMLFFSFLMLRPTPSNAMLLLELQGKIVSFTEEWVSLDHGRVRYTINRSKLRPEDSEQIKSIDTMVSFVVDPDSIIEARTVR
jgi:hypothetical protein